MKVKSLIIMRVLFI